MRPQKSDLEQDLKAFRQEFTALRDEVRLKLHLAGMELKTEWSKLEPQLDRAVSSATIVSGEAVADLRKRLAEFKTRLAPS